MTNPLIYYAYTPRKRVWERRPSILAVAALEEAGFALDAHPCTSPFDYAEGLRAAWQHPGDLLILEHDMAPTVEQVRALFDCPRNLCAGLYWITLGLSGHRPLLSACEGPLGTAVNGVQNPRITPGDDHAGYSGIGCCKLSAAVRQKMEPPPVCQWLELEIYVNRVVGIGGRWHIHYPIIPHHHGFMEDAYGVYASEPGASLQEIEAPHLDSGRDGRHVAHESGASLRGRPEARVGGRATGGT